MPPLHSTLLVLVSALFVTACGSNDNLNTPGPTDATYDVSFVSDWSAATHPDNFPTGSAHFSGLVGTTHNASVSFWNTGENASTGIKTMAETGQQSELSNEVDVAIQQSNADKVILGGGIGTSPGTINFTLSMQTSHPLLTLVSMLAPSPDWFVGVSGLNLYENNVWVDTLTVDLFVYDAGTDSGDTYLSTNLTTDPTEPIRKIITTPFFVSNEVVPIGKFIFNLQSTP